MAQILVIVKELIAMTIVTERFNLTYAADSERFPEWLEELHLTALDRLLHRSQYISKY